MGLLKRGTGGLESTVADLEARAERLSAEIASRQAAAAAAAATKANVADDVAAFNAAAVEQTDHERELERLGYLLAPIDAELGELRPRLEHERMHSAYAEAREETRRREAAVDEMAVRFVGGGETLRELGHQLVAAHGQAVQAHARADELRPDDVDKWPAPPRLPDLWDDVRELADALAPLGLTLIASAELTRRTDRVRAGMG